MKRCSMVFEALLSVVIQEIKRRRDLIISEPNGVVREQMISNLALGL